MCRRGRGDRGAILIQVAISIFVLTAFSAFVLDYGVMWTSRRQAQNAADAGALAGAVARAFDETTDPPSSGGAAYQSAYGAARQNNVWGTPPAANVSWTCPSFVTGGGCVQVDVYQDGTNGSSTLPTYFAPLLGVTSQGVRATATAQAGIANASDCLKPWAMPDKWIENYPTPGPWTSTSTYDHYQTNGKKKGQPLANPDVYTAPTATSTGTGFTVATDYGTLMTLKYGGGGNSIGPGDWLPVDLPNSSGAFQTGGNAYSNNIAQCNGYGVSIGEYLPIETGNMQGPTKQGVQALIAQDPNATWDSSTKSIDNSCAPGCGALSPRIVALAVYNPDKYQYSLTNTNWTYCPSGGSCVQVTNILGYFVAGIDNQGTVTGYLFDYPGVMRSGSATVGASSGFAKVITLVR